MFSPWCFWKKILLKYMFSAMEPSNICLTVGAQIVRYIWERGWDIECYCLMLNTFWWFQEHRVDVQSQNCLHNYWKKYLKNIVSEVGNTAGRCLVPPFSWIRGFSPILKSSQTVMFRVFIAYFYVTEVILIFLRLLIHFA